MTDNPVLVKAVFGHDVTFDAAGNPIEKGSGNLTDRKNPKPALSYPSGYKHPEGSKPGVKPTKVEP